MEKVEPSQPKDGEVLLRTVFLSLDPYMRGRMNAGPSYAPPIEVGAVMEGATVSQVIESRSPSVQPGDFVLSRGGWQDFSVSNAKHVRKLDPAVAPVSTALGILGMPGMTAYTGLLLVGAPKPGETVAVAAAAGAVGSAVGQIAKIKGCRAVGIAGGAQKCDFVINELGFDACLDHKSPTFAADLQAACPNGIDVYFEYVGGHVFRTVLPLLNPFSRVPVCGLIAQYNSTELPEGPDRVPLLMGAILTKRITMRGFIVSDFASHSEEFERDMAAWIRDGRVRYREDLVDGLENAVREFQGLLRGENFGKLIVRVSNIA
jgi:NADPH-dependent curcumin reductase CurA